MSKNKKEEKKLHIPVHQIYQYFKTEKTLFINSTKKIPYTIVPDQEDMELVFLLEKNILEERNQRQQFKAASTEQKKSQLSLKESKHISSFYKDCAHQNYQEQLKAFTKDSITLKKKFSYRLENIPSNLTLHRHAPLPGTHAFQEAFLKFTKFQLESANQDLIKIAEFYPTAYLVLGMSYIFLNQPSESNTYFEKAKKHKEWIFNRLNFEDGSSWFFAGFYLDKIEHNPCAALFYNKAVKLKFSAAQIMMGVLYYNNGLHDKAFTLFQQSAKQADPIGQTYLATCYGLKDSSPERKIFWLKRAARQGSTPAQTQLALYFLQLEPPNYTEAIPLLEKAILHKNPEALYLYGLLKLDGKGLTKNVREGIGYLIDSANFNFPKANYMVGKLISEGVEIEYNAELAQEYLEKAAACNLAVAIELLGKLFPATETPPALNCSK